MHYLDGFLPGKYVAWDDTIPFDKSGFERDVCTSFLHYAKEVYGILLSDTELLSEYQRISIKSTIDNPDDMVRESELFFQAAIKTLPEKIVNDPATVKDISNYVRKVVAEKSSINTKRSFYNEKALKLVNSGDLQGFTPEHIFNMFSGRVKEDALKEAGVSFDKFSNLHDFFAASRKIMQGQYFTPDLYAAWIMTALNPKPGMNIADLTCGKGVFFNYCPEGVTVFGNELDPDAYAIVKFLYPDATITNTDFLHYGGPALSYKKSTTHEEEFVDVITDATLIEQPEKKIKKKSTQTFSEAPRLISLDVVVGNPPFGLQWEKNGETIKSHHYYLKRSADFMRPGGIMAVIVPETYLANPDLDKKMIMDVNDLYNYECQIKLPEAAFQKVSVKNYGTKLMIFQRRHEKIPHKPYLPEHAKEFIDVPFTPETAKQLHDYLIRPLYQKNERLHTHSILSDRDVAEARFYYQYKKYLAELSLLYSKSTSLYDQYSDYYNKDRMCPPSLQKKEWDEICKKIEKGLYYSEKKKTAERFYSKYRNQVKPPHLTDEEWAKVSIKRGHVLAYVKRLVCDQQKENRDELKMVKSKYHVYWKGYSSETRKKAKELNQQIGDTSIIAWILHGDLSQVSEKGIRSYLEKRRREYEYYQQPLRHREQDKKIEEFFKDWSVRSEKRNRNIIPNKR